MKVQLIQAYKSFNKIYLPGNYNLEDLPLSIRNNTKYVIIVESDSKEDSKNKVVPKRKSIDEDNNAPPN